MHAVRGSMTVRTGTLPSRVPFVLGALVLAGAVVAVFAFFVGTHFGQVIDEHAFDGAAVWRAPLARAASATLDALPAVVLVVGIVAVAIITLVRRVWVQAIVALAAVAGANLSTQVLKNVVFQRPETGVADGLANSLPSGHTTAAASIALAVFLISSPRARPFAAFFGALFAVATGAATLINQWHRPSDVIAALCIVAFWGCVAGFVLARRRSARAPAAGVPAGMLPVALAALGCAVVGLIGFAVTASGAVTGSTHLFVGYLGAIGAIAATGLALAVAGNRLFCWLR